MGEIVGLMILLGNPRWILIAIITNLCIIKTKCLWYDLIEHISIYLNQQVFIYKTYFLKSVFLRVYIYSSKNSW